MNGKDASVGLRLLGHAERALNYASAMFIMVMMLVITASVITRNLFNRPLPGTYETAELLMLGLIFLGMAYVQSRRRHIAVTFVHQWLPRPVRYSVDLLTLALAIAFWAAFTWESAQRAALSWEIREFRMGVVRFPLYPAWTVLPVGAGLLTVRLTVDLLLVAIRGPEALQQDQAPGDDAGKPDPAP